MRKFITVIFLLTFLSSSAAVTDTLAVIRKKSASETNLPNGRKAECNIICDCPQVDNPQFNAAFTSWLKGVANQFFEHDGDSLIMMSALEGMFYKNLKREISLASTSLKDAPVFNVALDLEVKKLYEKKSFVTFRQNWIYYSAAGIRSEITQERSFNKISGEALKWADVIAPKKLGQFKKIVVAALGPYFGVRDLENLKSKMTKGDAVTYQNFPLPSAGPCFEKAGLKLIYAKGEIASSDVGHPSALIPYSSIASCLSPSAKKLIK